MGSHLDVGIAVHRAKEGGVLDQARLLKFEVCIVERAVTPEFRKHPISVGGRVRRGEAGADTDDTGGVVTPPLKFTEETTVGSMLKTLR
jgi:hypothetical protein